MENEYKSEIKLWELNLETIYKTNRTGILIDTLPSPYYKPDSTLFSERTKAYFPPLSKKMHIRIMKSNTVSSQKDISYVNI